jgi:predicted Fe-Mo cluster-binding NifX family protein
MCISLEKLRIAIPTKGHGGLEDVVSDVFGRANTFTIIDVKEGIIENVKVLENPAVSYQKGAGPIVVKMLIDAKVNMAIAAEFGPCISTLLDQHSVTKITVPAGTKISETIKNALPKIQSEEEFVRKSNP